MYRMYLDSTYRTTPDLQRKQMHFLYFTVAGLEEQSVLFPAVMAEVSVLKLLGTKRRIWKRMKDQMWGEIKKRCNEKKAAKAGFLYC